MKESLKKFYEAHKKGFQVFFKIIRYLAYAVGIAWGVINLAIDIFSYQTFVKDAATILNTSVTNLYVEPSIFNVPFLTKVYVSSFTIFFFLASIATLLGILILSRGRSTIEIVGLFIGFIIPRQRKYWGIIYDQSSNAPITFANVRVIKRDSSGKETVVSSTVTDLDGRYRVHLEDKSEEYILQVKADGYKTFEKAIDYKYQSLIQSIIIEDIPLTKLAQRPNLVKRFIEFIRPKLYTFVIYFLLIFTVVAFLWSLYGLLVFFWYDTVTYFAIYAFALVWNIKIIWERLKAKSGRIIDAKTKQPIAGAMIRVFDESRQILSALSAADGTVKLDLPSGFYTIKVDKENYEFKHYDDKQLLTVKVGQDGYLSKDIYMDKVGENASSKVSANLMNPFA